MKWRNDLNGLLNVEIIYASSPVRIQACFATFPRFRRGTSLAPVPAMGPAIDRLARRVRRLGRLAGELQELATDLATELAIVRRTLAADASGRLSAAVECGLLRAAHARQQDTLRAAAAGAKTLETRPLRNGAAMVRIDEGAWFKLSRRDAGLLHVLAHAGTPDADGFPAWQTYDQVGEELGRKAGVRLTHRALVESVYRVRRALKSADLNPYLLQVDRTLGRLRFLLRSHPRGPALRTHGHS